ncbi:hypothetical protein [Taylorella equigenitalis]|uniref:hypothetical protein n=1 Tax=Taylorella equigenitalis TaxID=29575 RepID=UPI0003062996|nr:hypothetical protein [Taylorella equigenitalis]
MMLDEEQIVDYDQHDDHREVVRHCCHDMLHTTAYDDAGRLLDHHTPRGEYFIKSILLRHYHYDEAAHLIIIIDDRQRELIYRHDPPSRLLIAAGAR